MEEMGSIRDAVRITGALPYIEAAIAQAESALFNRVLGELAQSTLTPDKALYAWMQIRAYRDLYRKLRSGVAEGQSVGHKFSDVPLT